MPNYDPIDFFPARALAEIQEYLEQIDNKSVSPDSHYATALRERIDTWFRLVHVLKMAGVGNQRIRRALKLFGEDEVKWNQLVLGGSLVPPRDVLLQKLAASRKPGDEYRAGQASDADQPLREQVFSEVRAACPNWKRRKVLAEVRRVLSRTHKQILKPKTLANSLPASKFP